MAEARTVLQKFLLLAGCQIGESLWARRTSEGKKAIAINSGETRKSFVQLLATHTLDRVAPKAVHFSDDAHVLDSFFEIVEAVWLRFANHDVAVAAVDDCLQLRLLRASSADLY